MSTTKKNPYTQNPIAESNIVKYKAHLVDGGAKTRKLRKGRKGRKTRSRK
jgi:hypothetical protein